jgi:hypothetical protein
MESGEAQEQQEHHTKVPRPSDPSWVHRKDPDELPRYSTAQGGPAKGVGKGEGVGFDPASATVAMVGGAAAPSSGASVSQTDTLPQTHEMGGKGDPQALGAVGSDTQVGTFPHAQGAGPRDRDRASAGNDAVVGLCCSFIFSIIFLTNGIVYCCPAQPVMIVYCQEKETKEEYQSKLLAAKRR